MKENVQGSKVNEIMEQIKKHLREIGDKLESDHNPDLKDGLNFVAAFVKQLHKKAIHPESDFSEIMRYFTIYQKNFTCITLTEDSSKVIFIQKSQDYILLNKKGRCVDESGNKLNASRSLESALKMIAEIQLPDFFKEIATA